MRLQKPQPESLLQPGIPIHGQVAASCQLNLWEHDDHIHKRSGRTDEACVPWSGEGSAGRRAVDLPHRGRLPSQSVHFIDAILYQFCSFFLASWPLNKKKWKWKWKALCTLLKKTAELVKWGSPNLQCFDLIWFVKGESQYYNAYEKDIAVVNIFFGSSTVFGLESSTYFEQFRTIDVEFNTLFLLSVWEISKDDLAGLYLKPRRTLWTLSWNQFHLCHRTCVLVHHQVFQGSFGPCCLIQTKFLAGIYLYTHNCQ